MQVGKFWLITINTINGPWHVSSLNDGLGALMPAFHAGGKRHRGGSWYIVNKDTGDAERIGSVRSKGTNYCDRAKEEAKRRNRELGFPQTPKEADRYLLRDTKDEDLGLIVDKLQTAEGEEELKNRIVNSSLRTGVTKDAPRA